MSVLTEGKWVWTNSSTAAVSANNMTLFATTLLHFPSSSSSSSSFQTVIVTAWYSISKATELIPTLKGLLMGPAKFPFVFVHWEDFISRYVCKQTVASFHWKMSTTKCRTQQAYRVHGVLDFTAVFMGDYFLLHFIHVTGSNQHHTYFTHLDQ